MSEQWNLEIPMNYFEILHSGDRRAVERLLQWLDPFLMGVIHLRLIKNRLRMAVETMDVFQSLIKDFINPQANRRPPADRSGGIERYLSAAVHNKIVTRLRKEARHAGDAENHRNLVSAKRGPGGTRRKPRSGRSGESASQRRSEVGVRPADRRIFLGRDFKASLGPT